MDEMKLAREIEDCDDCPLYGNDCPGGWTGGPNGPIEPPCCSWNGDEEISKGMYSNITYLPQELKWRQEAHEQKEAEKRAAKHKEEIENLEAAATASASQIKLDLSDATNESRELAVAFARRFNDLTPKDQNEILTLLKNRRPNA